MIISMEELAGRRRGLQRRRRSRTGSGSGLCIRGKSSATGWTSWASAPTALAKALNVPHNRISAIRAGKRSISAETALRLARYLGTSADLWINLQADYDRERAEQALGERIAREVTPRAA